MSEITLAKFSVCEDRKSIIEFGTSCEDVMTNKNSDKLHKGCKITWNRRYRCYRVAAQFLGLLCVVLLAAIIMLYVEYKRIQTNYNYTVNSHLSEERDMLTKEREKLQLEKGGLQKALSHFGWKYFKSSTYSISTVKMNWRVGRQHCIKSEADLVVINSKEEMIFVHGLISNLGAWLGLTDTVNEGVWKWVDGKGLTTSYWMKGQPNNGGRNGTDDCGVIVFGKAVLESWNDSQCNYLSYVICEKSLA
ncbi:CD209 antigen-like protein C isoform X2 [Triplophysa dalaica]|uniref:CD209 antigen-like protein C isoform X2 n=1 Tax=Triplophysa dalaica TaxID=1582913 RepID=UPI0024DF3B25|nr:CD209 antigen-like protein C isoform X2 [Triplophysa dalaica]